MAEAELSELFNDVSDIIERIRRDVDRQDDRKKNEENESTASVSKQVRFSLPSSETNELKRLFGDT